MPRAMSTQMLSAIAQGALYPALFFQATFLTGTVYLWTGMGAIAWGGHTYSGIGTAGSITTIEEGSTLEARGITLQLSGLDATVLQDVLGEFQLGTPVAVYLGLFSAANPASLIANPVLAWAGLMDQPGVEVSGQTATISIACENKLISMNVAIDRRYTNDDQQRDYPGDLGMMFVNGIQEMTLYWGTAPTSTNNI